GGPASGAACQLDVAREVWSASASPVGFRGEDRPVLDRTPRARATPGRGLVPGDLPVGGLPGPPARALHGAAGGLDGHLLPARGRGALHPPPAPQRGALALAHGGPADRLRDPPRRPPGGSPPRSGLRRGPAV